MSTKEKFKGFSYEHNEKYKQAAIDRYGSEVIEEAIERHKGNEEAIASEFNRIFFAFAENLEKGIPATRQENVRLAKELHEHLCRYSFDCSIDIFASIGRGYVQNEEFKQNLDKYGTGTAQYVCDAIQEYVKSS